MAEKSWLWDGDSGSGGVGDCGPYAANDYDDINEILWTGPNANSAGVRPRYGNELLVEAGSGKVTVATGAAIVKGKPYKNTASVDVSIPTPTGSTRYDRVVLRADYTAQTVRITRIAGSEGGSAPAITQSDGVTWDLPLAIVKITTGGTITIETDERRPIDQGMGAMPGEMRMWDGSLSGSAYPVIGSMIYDEWRAMNTSTTYNGYTIRDYSDRAPMGVGTHVATVGATAGAATKNMAHTHGVGTLAAANESAHTHGGGTLGTDTAPSHAHQQQGTTSGPSAFASDLGEGALSTAASKTHTHTLSGYTVGAGGHSHTVNSGATAAGSAHTHSLSGATASGGSATQDVLNPVFGTYFIKYCPA